MCIPTCGVVQQFLFSTTHGRHHKSINCHSCTMRISWSKHQANMKAWTTSLIAPAEVQVRQGTARQACRSCTNSPIATVASQQACRSCTNSPIATVASQQACRSCTNSPIATVASQQACRSCTNSPIATVASQQACRSCTNSPIATVASQQACELL